MSASTGRLMSTLPCCGLCHPPLHGKPVRDRAGSEHCGHRLPGASGLRVWSVGLDFLLISLFRVVLESNRSKRKLLGRYMVWLGWGNKRPSVLITLLLGPKHDHLHISELHLWLSQLHSTSEPNLLQLCWKTGAQWWLVSTQRHPLLRKKIPIDLNHTSSFSLKPYSTVLIAPLSIAHMFLWDEETVCSSGLFFPWQNQARLRLSPCLS